MGRSKTVPVEELSPRVLNEVPEDLSNGSIKNYGQRFEYSPDFEGPVKKRSCTDLLCLLLFVALLGGWGFVAYIGFTQGDIEKVRKEFEYFRILLSVCLANMSVFWFFRVVFWLAVFVFLNTMYSKLVIFNVFYDRRTQT